MPLTNLPVLDRTPLEALDIYTDGEEGREDNNSFDAVLLALVVLWLGRPAQECNNILSHLRCCCRST